MQVAPPLGPARVHPSAYTSRKLFHRELERIWYRHWVYVGHESEVPDSGAVADRWIALEPVAMIREGTDVRVVRRRCPTCSETCTIGVSGGGVSGGRWAHCRTCQRTVELAAWASGAADVERVESYQGFVFASLSPNGMPLVEHLAHAAPRIDRMMKFSPTGRIVVSGGVRTIIRANWKQPLENACEGYHAVYLHRSVYGSALADDGGREATKLRMNDNARVSVDLGNGHSLLGYAPGNHAQVDHRRLKMGVSPEEETRHIESLAEAWGRDVADELVKGGLDHIALFPNMAFVNQDIRTFTPLSERATIVTQYLMRLEGAPERLNAARRWAHTNSYGPGGMIAADDFDVFNHVQLASIGARPDDRMTLTRGVHRERVESGRLTSNGPDETSQRALWRRYSEIMNTQGGINDSDLS